MTGRNWVAEPVVRVLKAPGDKNPLGPVAKNRKYVSIRSYPTRRPDKQEGRSLDKDPGLGTRCYRPTLLCSLCTRLRCGFLWCGYCSRRN